MAKQQGATPAVLKLEGKSVLVTGGTGSFGQQLTDFALRNCRPKKWIVFSRDELKQQEMRVKFGDGDPGARSPLRFFLGDVRDKERLYRAFVDVDIVIHAAALKQIPAAEYNPLEAIRTNIMGAANVIDAAIDRGVKEVIGLSSDKAVDPINLYGATKLCSEKLFVAANSYSGTKKTRFSAVRYGNVLGSRGSVLPLFMKARRSGRLPVTDRRMTRFWLTLEHGVRFVIGCLDRMVGGEIFIPKIPSMNIIDLARAVAPDCEVDIIGIRPGEKLHEVMISEEEARQAIEFDDHFVIQPLHPFWDAKYYRTKSGGRPCPEGFRYSSDRNDQWLTSEELRRMLRGDPGGGSGRRQIGYKRLVPIGSIGPAGVGRPLARPDAGNRVRANGKSAQLQTCHEV